MSLLTVAYFRERDARIAAQVSLRVQAERHEAEAAKLRAMTEAREVERDILLRILRVNGLGYSPARRVEINRARERAGEAPLPEFEVRGAVHRITPPQVIARKERP